MDIWQTVPAGAGLARLQLEHLAPVGTRMVPHRPAQNDPLIRSRHARPGGGEAGAVGYG
jgi:hypothetical protein